MTTLNEVLAKREEVLNLIDQFGFARQTDIYCGVEPLQTNKVATLVLTINHKSQNISIDPENASLLEAKLADILQCTVKINMTEGSDSYQEKALAKRSAPIEDTGRLCFLFGVNSPEDVTLDDSEKPDQTLLKRANAYLGETSSVGVKKLSNAQAASNHGLLPDSNSGSGEERELKKSKAGSSASSSPDKTDSPLKNLDGFTKK